MDKHKQSAQVYRKFDKHFKEEHLLAQGAKKVYIRVKIVGEEQIVREYHDHDHIYYDLKSYICYKTWKNLIIEKKIEQQPQQQLEETYQRVSSKDALHEGENYKVHQMQWMTKNVEK